MRKRLLTALELMLLATILAGAIFAWYGNQPFERAVERRWKECLAKGQSDLACQEEQLCLRKRRYRRGMQDASETIDLPRRKKCDPYPALEITH